MDVYENKKEYDRLYYIKNKEKRIAQQKMWSKNNKERDLENKRKWCLRNRDKRYAYSRKSQISHRGIYNSIKSNACKKSLFLCSFVEFKNWYEKQKQKCVYCDLPLSLIHLDKKHINNGKVSPRLTIERKDNNVGYRIENIALACRSCNVVKNNILNYEDMLFIGKKFIKPKWEREAQNRDI